MSDAPHKRGAELPESFQGLREILLFPDDLGGPSGHNSLQQV
jgi:hypothetical protein